MNFDVFSILALITTLGVGVYCGYRYAVAARSLDAVIAASLDRLDLTPEDENAADRCCSCRPPWSGR